MDSAAPAPDSGPAWSRRGPGGGPPWAGRRPGRRHGHARVAPVVIVLLISVFGAQIAARHQAAARPLDAAGYTLLAVAALALLARVRWRVPVYALVCAATAAYLVLGYPYGAVFLAPLVAMFGAVRTGHQTPVWAVTWLAYLTVVLLPVFAHSIGGLHPHRPGVLGSILGATWILIALAVAGAVRVRAERFTEIARTHAEQQRARAEQERRQASEERLRIARELHDVLGHHLSLINVQAGVGLHLMDEQPEQARAALEAIKQASAEALGEVRAVLGVLRPKGEEAPRSPVPSLANIATLVDPADTAVVGEPVPLPPEVDRAAFRIVQESLTNVRRHAGAGATARVTVAYRPDVLVVTVTDDGAGPPAGGDGGRAGGDGDGTRPGGDGNGIGGMRARAQALGGTLYAGAALGGGYRVTATLPLRSVAAEGREAT